MKNYVRYKALGFRGPKGKKMLIKKNLKGCINFAGSSMSHFWRKTVTKQEEAELFVMDYSPNICY